MKAPSNTIQMNYLDPYWSQWSCKWRFSHWLVRVSMLIEFDEAFVRTFNIADWNSIWLQRVARENRRINIVKLASRQNTNLNCRSAVTVRHIDIKPIPEDVKRHKTGDKSCVKTDFFIVNQITDQTFCMLVYHVWVLINKLLSSHFTRRI